MAEVVTKSIIKTVELSSEDHAELEAQFEIHKDWWRRMAKKHNFETYHTVPATYQLDVWKAWGMDASVITIREK